MDTNLLPEVSGKENSDKSNTTQEATYFRGKQISWKIDERYITKTTENAFDSANPDNDEVLRHYNLILYNGKTYERVQFLKAMFADYQKYQYKVKFNTDNIFYLGSSQRAKLQYHILAQRFKLVQVEEKDRKDLEAFCSIGYSRLAEKWLQRMLWKNGHENMISFGVALEVAGTAKDVWCYWPQINDTEAIYNGIAMTWEEWEQGIKDFIVQKKVQLSKDNKGKLKLDDKECKSKLYYQNGNYLTLPVAQMIKLEQWIEKYIKYGNAKFPYSGNIPNSDLRFTIDFEKDIEIVAAFPYALKYPEQAAEWNRKNNAIHNREVIGRNKVKQTFSRVVGDEWTTAELRQQGFNDKNIKRFVDYGFIERIKRGHYRRILE